MRCTSVEFPYISEAMSILANDNNMNLRPRPEWPTFIDYNILNQELAQMPIEEINAFVAGDDEQQTKLREKYDIKNADIFLFSVFDNCLESEFFTNSFRDNFHSTDQTQETEELKKCL